MIMQDFDQSDSIQFRSTLYEACFALDAIGQNAIEGLRNWFCVNQLDSYRELFAPGKAEASFENTKRRFAWFKRTLKEATSSNGVFGVFPEVW
jgi:hypothetical protein